MKTVTIGKHKVIFKIEDDRESVWLEGQCLGLLHPRCNDWAQKAQIARLIVRAYSLHNTLKQRQGSSVDSLVDVLRVYNNGYRTRSKLTLEQASESMRFRPGCAYFIDGKCVQEGYLGEERCASIAKEISAEASGRAAQGPSAAPDDSHSNQEETMKHLYHLIQRMFSNLRSSRGDKYGAVIMRMFGVDEKEAILICHEFGYHADKRIPTFNDNSPPIKRKETTNE